MRRTFTLLLLLAFLALFQPVHAQGLPSLSAVNVQIWPEYDQPSVLVIEYITVSPTTSLPATMTFQIPAAAEKPYALAVGQTPDAVGDTAYTLKENGAWMDVIVEVTAPYIQLEYYDPSIAKDGKNRQYKFSLSSNYAVDALHVELQQPYDASDLKTTPSLPNVTPVQDGLTYYSGDFGAQKAGESFSLDFRYVKDSDALSISFMNIQPASPVNENTTGRVSLQTFLPWLVAGAGVLMIAGGMYYYYRGNARPRANVRRRHSSSEQNAEGQTYCPQCGTRARDGDRFCRVCGTRLRTEV